MFFRVRRDAPVIVQINFFDIVAVSCGDFLGQLCIDVHGTDAGVPFVIYKVTGKTTQGFEIAGYLLGGPFGIVASMWAFKRFTMFRRAPR